jgi:hypothetical protein
MKYRLNTDDLNDDFFHNTRLLGIIAPIKNFQFCWLLNKAFFFQFRLNPDLEIQLRKKDRNYFFSIYEGRETNDAVIHYLYHNHFQGEYLLPELKHIDFLWLLKGNNITNDQCAWLLQAVKKINGVQLVVELTNEQIKNKSNMIF